jgi:hypothetical protein
MNRRVFAASVGEVSMATVVMVVVAAAAAAAASRHRTVRGTNSTHHFILTGLSINQSITVTITITSSVKQPSHQHTLHDLVPLLPRTRSLDR